MPTNDFNIGDQVYYLGEGKENKHKYHCIVTGIVGNMVTCTFRSIRDGKVYGDYTFTDSRFEFAGPPSTKEERILAKCKHLWNESNWVLNKQEQAY